MKSCSENDVPPPGGEYFSRVKTRRRLLSDWLPVLLYCLLIFFQSAFPPVVSEPIFPFADKAAHGMIYAVLGILFYKAFKTRSVKNPKAAGWAVLASTLYGVSDEIHQAFVPVRSAEMADVLADGLGSLLGVLLFVILFPAFRKSPTPAPEPPLQEIQD
ncbi:MAG: hypothetical protein COS92_05115 [Desulfobacterales bacterium CG07_land_8_20_14_0_80_52_14]|nr:MAG: hypothetical protein COX20_07280 [Desulfobacterales bacterium CG23_combo_of_CG06-09_8_20_14_all_52_9]PIU49699.1 MAG: hypothetical protein COS92_05115 [Desulfobacterales bacterium CG07_land_8_20_14_0_80_52_14]